MKFLKNAQIEQYIKEVAHSSQKLDFIFDAQREVLAVPDEPMEKREMESVLRQRNSTINLNPEI